MITYKTYLIKKAGYSEIYDYEVNLPKDMKLLYKDGSVGDVLQIGFNHYIGCLRINNISQDYMDYLKKSHLKLNTYKFNDLLFIVFNNIKFINEEPEYYTSNEFMQEFELNKYYIEFKYEDEFDYDNFKKFLSKESNELLEDINIEDIKKYRVKGKTYRICRITSIEGPYDITMFTVANYSPFSSETEMYMISEENGVKIQYMCDSLNIDKLIYKNDSSKFNEMLNNVLNRNK